MKTTKFKAMAILVGLVLSNIQSMCAGVIDNVNKVDGGQISSFNMQGLIVMGGIVGASLLLYIVTTYVIKDKDEPILDQKSQINRHNHHRHHRARNVVKKTS
jgi:hypothetical protein